MTIATSQPSTTVQYFCPPCGCDRDSIVYEKSGICSDLDCSMMLLSGNREDYEKKLANIDFAANKYFQQFYNLIIYPAIIQGFILVLLLLTTFRQKRKANYFLALIVFSITVQNLSYYFFEINLEQDSNFAYLFFPLSYILVIGPALYFYTYFLLRPKTEFKLKNIIYFVPAFVSIIYNSAHFFYSGQMKHKLIHSPSVLTFNLFEQILSIVFIAYFSTRSLVLLKKHDKWITNKFSDISRLNLNWLNRLIKNFILIVVLWIFVLSLGWYVSNSFIYDFKYFKENYYPLWISFSLLIYWFAYVSILKSKLLSDDIDLSDDKYENTDINEKLLNRLIHSMDIEKMYLDSSLTIDKLAALTEIDVKIISTILNQLLKKNFFTFINEYRVNECKNRIIDEQFNHLNLLGIAIDAGFSSKSTFNLSFKKITGLTPKQYKNKHSKKS